MKNILSASVIAILCALLLALSYPPSRYLPYKIKPRLWYDLKRAAASSEQVEEVRIDETLAFCAMGNIYRCRCRIANDLKNKGKNDFLIKALQIIDKRIKDQTR